MKAAVLRAHGAVPEFSDYEEPTPGPGQALVQVSAAGMNPVEILIASGDFYAFVPEVPSVVGREGVGTLEDGRRVFFPACVPPFGSFAERAVIPAESAIPLPDEIDDGTAIALWTSGLAAWMPLDHSAMMRSGESVLVLGAGSVVGQLALQSARIRGAGRIVAAARSEKALAKAIDLGADATVALADGDDSRRSSEELADVAGDGFDIVLDLLSGPYTQLGLNHLKRRGRHVLIGSLAGDSTVVSSAALRGRNAALIGYSSAIVEPPLLVAGYAKLLELARAGALHVNWEAIPLAEVDRAWDAQLDGPGHKLVLTP